MVKKATSRTSKAELQFPIGKISRFLKTGGELLSIGSRTRKLRTEDEGKDNAINSLTSKSAQSHGSTYKNRRRGFEGLEELESMTPAAYSEPPRNMQLSLRSASAKKKPSTLPRRSARLVPK